MRSIGSAAAAGVAAVALAVVGAVAVLAVWRSGGAAAGWIESLFRREDYAEMLASHYLRAVEYAGAGGVVREELVERTVRALRDAGDRALSLHAYPLAAGFYERAMALQPDGASGPRRELLLSLGDALARAGDQERARETFLTAAELARRSGAAEHLARAALGYGGRFIWSRAWGDPHSSPSSRRPWRSWAMRTATCASVCWRGWPRVRCVTRFRLSRARR